MADFSVIATGAVGDGQTDDTLAIQTALDRCALTGGRVIVPAPGRYLTGTVTLRDRTELHVERGAVIVGVGCWDAYASGPLVSGLSSGVLGAGSAEGRALLRAKDASGIAVTGGGVIDGGGRHFVIRDLGEIYQMRQQRPFSVFFAGCSQVTLRDITFTDAAYWTVRLSDCEDVLIDGVRIRNDPKLPNNDGIDLDWCRRVRVTGCDIDTGDDGISVKTCEEFAGSRCCEDIVVTGCVIRSRSSALVIGCDLTGPVRRVLASGCLIRSSHRGVSVNLSQQGSVEDVLVTGCLIESQFDDDVWWGNGEPVYVSAEPWHDRVGMIRGLSFRDLRCRAENGVVVQSIRPGLVTGVEFDRVRVEIGSWTGRPGGRLDLRPTAREPFRAQPGAGFLVENASRVRLDRCEVCWQGGRQPWWGAALAVTAGNPPEVDGLRENTDPR